MACCSVGTSRRRQGASDCRTAKTGPAATPTRDGGHGFSPVGGGAISSTSGTPSTPMSRCSRSTPTSLRPFSIMLMKLREILAELLLRQLAS